MGRNRGDELGPHGDQGPQLLVVSAAQPLGELRAHSVHGRRRNRQSGDSGKTSGKQTFLLSVRVPGPGAAAYLVGNDPEITTVARCGILRYSCGAAFRQADKER
ncbi:hypothetical protein GCM10017673_41990 [Streptosporangium violaceochromogenes]|nr:hypothetical protein GCM10017673_41990 [Streptosporangium violaceochromogenes]